MDSWELGKLVDSWALDKLELGKPVRKMVDKLAGSWAGKKALDKLAHMMVDKQVGSLVDKQAGSLVGKKAPDKLAHRLAGKKGLDKLAHKKADNYHKLGLGKLVHRKVGSFVGHKSKPRRKRECEGRCRSKIPIPQQG